MSSQALVLAPTDAEAHAAYLEALNRRNPAEVLLVADAHREASNPAVVVEVRSPPPRKSFLSLYFRVG